MCINRTFTGTYGRIFYMKLKLILIIAVFFISDANTHILDCKCEENENIAKEFSFESNRFGFNLKFSNKIKFIDGNLYYILIVGDLDKNPINETSYWDTLKDKRLTIKFVDSDGFVMLKDRIIMSQFDATFEDGIYQKYIQRNYPLEKSKYVLISDISYSLGVTEQETKREQQAINVRKDD